MATVLNKLSASGTDNSGVEFLFGIIILVIIGFFVFVFGLPLLRELIGPFS